MSKKNEVALWTNPQSFAIVAAADVAMNPELAELMDESDQNGFEPPTTGLPRVQIRQKELRDKESGKKVVAGAGGFRIYDPVSQSAGVQTPDVDGEVGLILTPVLDGTSRVYWPSLNDPKPSCKSLDGKFGQGNPGGECATCPMNQWVDGERPACNQQQNVLVYDWAMRTCYVFQLGRSALRPWSLFKAAVDRTGQPLHSFKIRVTSSYKSEPQPHFVPVFELGDQIDLESFKRIREVRQSWRGAYNEAVEADESPDNGNVHDTTYDDGDGGGEGELPEGVTPVNGEKDFL